MIKPKHSFGKKLFEVKEEFVDREDAKKLYWDKLNNNCKDYNVLVFYGVGGIGKSKLRREICRMHSEDNKSGITFYLDLSAPEERNLGEGILKLVDSCNTKIDFKCFELAYALYFRKKNPSFQYGREKGSISENTFVGVGLNILSIFDGGITATAADIVERSICAIANRTINKDVKEELKNFDNYSIAEMEERLPLFFKYDLQSYLNGDKSAKVLIVFDTFEALNENVIEQIHKIKNERWIQEIIEYFDTKQFPNLLITIFGRDKVEWGEDWQGVLEQHQLLEFEDDYSKEYLKKAGILDDTIVNEIIKSSDGHPLLLYLSLETYANLTNMGKKPDIKEFGGGYSEIIERFVYNLDKDTVEVLRLMSIPNFYNADIFRVLIDEFNISFPMTEFEQFNKYSFITYDRNENVYYIHDLMRKGMLEKTSERTLQSAHALLLKYYSSKINQGVSTKDILEMFYHARKHMNVAEFDSWLNTSISDNYNISPLIGMQIKQNKGEQSVLMQIINGITSNFETNQLLIELVNIYIDTVHLGGDYREAVSICEKYLNQFTKEEIVANEQLIRMKIRKIHHCMFYMPVDQLITEAKEILDQVDLEKYPEQYNELLFLLGGNLGVLSGNFDMASYWLNQSMACAKENNFDTFVHRTMRKQADIMLVQNDFDGALELLNQAVNVTMEVEKVDSRYKIYLMGVLGEVYRKKGKLDMAWHCFDIVEKKSSENHLPGWKAHAYLAKGMVQLNRNNFEEAGELFSKASNVYLNIHQQWGIINSEQAQMILTKLQGLELKKEDIENNLAIADRMNYRYNVSCAKKILEGKTPYLQLFFL